MEPGARWRCIGRWLGWGVARDCGQPPDHQSSLLGGTQGGDLMGRGTPGQNGEHFLACTWAQSRRSRAKNSGKALVATCAGPSCPPRDSCNNPGPAWDILGTLSPLLTLGIPRQCLQGGQSWGQSNRQRAGARVAPTWITSVQGRMGRGPHTHAFSLPQALSPGLQDGGVSAAQSWGAPAVPTLPTRQGSLQFPGWL